MHISLSSLIMSLIFGNVFIGIMMLILTKDKLISRFNINFIVGYLLLVMIRIALPIEFNFAKTIACMAFLPNIFRFLELTLWKSNITYLSILLFVWGTVAVIKFFVFIFSYMKTCSIISGIEKSDEKVICEILDEICKKYSHKNKFKVIRIKGSQSPFIFGLFYPTIVLPQMELSRTELKFILIHETEHYFHCDLWKKCIIEILSIVYWWNPLVYYLKRGLDEVLELRNDFCITDNLEEHKKIEYLECLLRIAKMNKKVKNQNQSLAFSRGITNNNAERRFAFILESPISKRRYNNYLCWIVSGLIMLLSFCFILEPYRITSQVKSNTYALSSESAYIVVKNNQYYIYVDDELMGKVTEIKDSYANLPIYKEDENE